MNNYLSRLEQYLTGLTPDERDEVLEFYQEFILDDGLETEAQIEAKLGSPRQLAFKILADYSIKSTPIKDETSSHKSKRNIRTIWLIILSLLSAPVTIPLLLIGLLGIGIAVFLVILFAFIALLMVGIVVVLGVCFLGAGISVAFTHFFVGLFYTGIGLIILSTTTFLLALAKIIISACVQMLANFTKYIYQKIQHRKSV